MARYAAETTISVEKVGSEWVHLCPDCRKHPA